MIKKIQDFEKSLQRVYNFLSYRPRSQKEIIEYLNKRVKDKKYTPKIIKKLEAQNLINDENFVDWWIDQRLNYSYKGPVIIKKELLSKGIDKNLIDNKINSLDKKIIKTSVLNLLKKKPKYLKNLKNRVQEYKLLKFLISRGYPTQMVKNLVDDFVKKR